MAETIISPGVFTRENDISFIQPAAAEAGAALVGQPHHGYIRCFSTCHRATSRRNNVPKAIQKECTDDNPINVAKHNRPLSLPAHSSDCANFCSSIQ